MKTRVFLKYFVRACSSLTVSVVTFDINERKTIFEISKVLNTMILPSSASRYTFNIFWISVILSIFFFCFFISLFFVVRKVNSSNFYGINTLHYTKCYFHNFKLSNICNFEFSLFGSNLKYFENAANALRSCLIDISSLKKKVVSSA